MAISAILVFLYSQHIMIVSLCLTLLFESVRTTLRYFNYISSQKAYNQIKDLEISIEKNESAVIEQALRKAYENLKQTMLNTDNQHLIKYKKKQFETLFNSYLNTQIPLCIRKHYFKSRYQHRKIGMFFIGLRATNAMLGIVLISLYPPLILFFLFSTLAIDLGDTIRTKRDKDLLTTYEIRESKERLKITNSLEQPMMTSSYAMILSEQTKLIPSASPIKIPKALVRNKYNDSIMSKNRPVDSSIDPYCELKSNVI